jgi:hypothetical protein
MEYGVWSIEYLAERDELFYIEYAVLNMEY